MRRTHFGHQRFSGSSEGPQGAREAPAEAAPHGVVHVLRAREPRAGHVVVERLAREVSVVLVGALGLGRPAGARDGHHLLAVLAAEAPAHHVELAPERVEGEVSQVRLGDRGGPSLRGS